MNAAALSGNERAALAIKMFVRRIVKYIGAYHCLVGGAQAIVFTGGIGEFSWEIRQSVIEGLAAIGIYLDQDRNKACFGKAGIISRHTQKLAAK